MDLAALGLPLILVSIPLALRWVPRNRIYGLRVPATLRSDSVWYDANALCARYCILLGLVMVGLEFVLPAGVRNNVLTAIGGVGFVSIIVAAWRAARRLDRERSQPLPH